MTIRICIDARAIGIYPGLGRYGLNLLKAMVRLAKQLDIITLVDQRLDRQTRSIIPQPYPVEYPLLSVGTITRIPSIVRAIKPQLFHSLFQAAPPVKRIPLVVTVHDMMDLDYSDAFSHHNFLNRVKLRTYFRYLVPLSITKSRAIVAVSNNTRNDIIRRFPASAEKITVIHEAAADNFKPIAKESIPNDFYNRYKLPKNYMLYLGSTKRYKNPKGMLQAYQRYTLMIGDPLPLVIAGLKNVSAGSLIELAKKLNIAERVLFIGPIDENDLAMLYSAARVLIFPSLYEGFGLPVLEAMACGTPVIASNAASLPEVVGDAGMMIEATDYNGFAQAMLALTKDDCLHEDYSHKGLQRAAMFSWEKVATETINLYKQAPD